MLAQNSDFSALLQSVDGEFLGVVMIIGTIGFFLSFIVVVVSIARTWNNIVLAKMDQNLIKELLAKGYSAEDIERLAYGGQRWSQRFRKLFQSAKTHFSGFKHRSHYSNQPVPPMKQSA